MPTVNQRIPNFLGGVSQQPDTIKFPGQVRVCDNAVPDVTFGLMKRPAGEFIKNLTNANATGYWYEILRDGEDKFLVQMTPAANYTSSKPFRIWALTDLSTGQTAGTELSLTNSNGDSLFAYMQQSGTNIPYAIQTVQDYTIVTNPQKTIGTTGTTTAPLNNADYAFARLDTIAYNTEYVLYAGNTVPTPNTYYRATALEVHKGTGDGNTWDDTNKDGRYAGLGQFSFSGGNNITVPGGQVAIEDLEGHVTVNAASYVDSNTANYSGGSSASDFLGYTQNYKIRYTAQITLKDGGLIKTTTKSTALGCYIDLTIEGISYRIKIVAVEPVETYENVSSIAFYRSPKNPDKGKLSMANIINSLHTSINSNLSNVTSEVIGNGMYLYGSAAPTINFLGGAVNENMNIIGNTAQDVSRLPSQCKDGYVAQIANDDNVDADNYYVKFYADNGTQGSGKWEECVRPNNFSSGSDPMVKGFDEATMPHALINNNNGTFTFKKLDEASKGTTDNYWKYREVGDDITNPFPSFNGKNIQKIFFHRNRLGMIADEQVVMSRPGDYFNFFVVSAITTSDDNPVDITVSDIKPAFINFVLPINKGVMMFSDNGQFILFTESDIFSPKTARLKKVSSFEAADSIQPIDMGTSTMFTSNVSAYTRAYEATILDDDVPPKVLEQTRVVPEFIPKDITMSANSVALGLVSFGKKNSSEIYHYKYFDSGERRDQSAWYSWTVTGTLQHMLYTAGSFFSVTLQGSDYVLNKHEYVTDATAARTYKLGDGAVGSPLATSRWFEVCLDNMTLPSSMAYTAPGGANVEKSVVTLPYTPTGAGNYYLVGLSGNDAQGNPVAGTVIQPDSVSTNGATFLGVNLTGWTYALGYGYTATIGLPSYFLALQENKYDLDGELRISGINFNMGVSGPMEFHLDSVYADMQGHIQYESGMKLDDSDFGKPPSQLSKEVRVPIQRKNEKYNLTIKIPDPFSTQIVSVSWDGNYSQKRHVRR